MISTTHWCHRWVIRELNIRRRRRQRKQPKSNRFRLAKPQLCTCITLFCTFLCRRCTSTTWKCQISRFVEDGNTRQQLSFSFPERWYSPLESTPKKVSSIWLGLLFLLSPIFLCHRIKDGGFIVAIRLTSFRPPKIRLHWRLAFDELNEME